MTTFKVPYYDLLVRMALYQKGMDMSLNFRFLTLPGEHPHNVLVQPITPDQGSGGTLPLFNLPDMDPIRLWMSFGYINLTHGSPGKGQGEFTLTDKTLSLDLLSGQ